MDACGWKPLIWSGALLAACWCTVPAWAQPPVAPAPATPAQPPPLPGITPPTAPTPVNPLAAPPATPATTTPEAAAAPAAAEEMPPPLLPSPGAAGSGTLASSLANPAAAADTSSASGLLGRSGLSPVILGDMLPISVGRAFPFAAAMPVTPPPPNPGVPPGAPHPPHPAALASRFVRAVVPSVRGFKVSENQSPRPQDRVFTSFNYYNDVNSSINHRLGGLISSMAAYRTNFGFEKTFLDGNASFGMRLPLDSLSVTTRYAPLGGTSTALGNLSVFGKYVLWQDEEKKNLISTGMMLTTPTGTSRFAGAPASNGYHDVLFQPFVGFFFAADRAYIQGFSAIEVPTNSSDLTMYYNDIGVGYFLYRNEDPHAFLSAFVPTFELHVNTPLNHRGALRAFDPNGTPDVVDLTYGTNIYFQRNTVLSLGVATPVTGPRPFAYEFMALLNIYFGRTRSSTNNYAVSPPVLR
jgi:hypothetical protein